MNKLANQQWLRIALFIAVVYPVVSILFAMLANPSAGRLAAWLVSAAAFAAHIWYEHFRLRNPPTRAALHVSGAAALGGFALAVWVLVHAQWVDSSHHSALAPLALVVFPAVTGLPAFVVALVALAVLARTHTGSQ